MSKYTIITFEDSIQSIILVLTADGTTATKEAFEDVGEPPDNYNTENDIERDATMHIGNVLTSLSQSIQRYDTTLSVHDVINRRRDPAAFTFICLNDENTETWETHCEDGSQAATSPMPGLGYMVLCPPFFDSHNVDETLAPDQEIDKSIKDDKYMYAKYLDDPPTPLNPGKHSWISSHYTMS